MDESADTRCLLLVRHSIAESDNVAGDFARELTDQGKVRAKELGQKIVAENVQLQIAIASSAVRAEQTMSTILGELPAKIEAKTNQSLYRCYAEDWVEVLKQLDNSITSAIIIGHEPVMSSLANKISGEQLRIQPCDAFIVEYNCDWQQISQEQSQIKQFFS